jgi:ABC-type amino acid transport substrate-binding protein
MRQLKTLLFVAVLFLSRPIYGSPPVSVSIPDFPPYYIYDQLGRRSGFATEVIELCFKKLNLTPAFRQLPIKRMFRDMESGNLEVNIMSFKEDRTKFLQYGKVPVFHGEYIAFVHRSFKSDFRSLTDLDPLNLGELIGLKPSVDYRTYADRRLQQRDKGRITVVGNVDSLIKMLAKKRIDVFIANRAEIAWRAKELQLDDAIKATNYVLASQDYFWTVAKKSPVLRARPDTVGALDRCVHDLSHSSELAPLEKRYGLSR